MFFYISPRAFNEFLLNFASNHNQRSCITSNFTQTNSKTDSSEGKANHVPKINNVLENNIKLPSNRHNHMPLKVKLNFDKSWR